MSPLLSWVELKALLKAKMMISSKLAKYFMGQDASLSEEAVNRARSIIIS